MSNSGEAKTHEELESQASEEESQSQQREVAESSNKGKLDEDSEEEVARAEDDDALPLACPFCELPFLDPVVTTCDHYFCNLCARKNPTLGVFKPSVEIKNKIAKMRENMKPQENKAAMFDFEEYTSQYIRNYHQGGPLLLRVLHMVTHKLLDEEEDNLQALQFLFDRLKPGKDIYRTNPEFLQLVSNLIGGRKGEKYIASQKMLQDMREQYTEILAIASREEEDMERHAHVLGSFLYASGHVREAYEALSKVQSTILFMVVALEARELEVLCSLNAVQTLRGVSCYEEMTKKEDCIRALAHLSRGDYYISACKFQEVMNMKHIRKLWTYWSFELSTLDDIYMYCTWTAIATMSRREIQEVADDMDKITFKERKKIESKEKKRVNYSYRYMLSQYNARNYSECIRFLHQQLQAKARRDIYLSDHVDRLFHLIKERCMRESKKFCSDFEKLSAIINN
ncbi:unnamed protein product [Brassica rapa]|uniref:RING-type domain-containing protein n=1 Tax=Brassica campestris TaxID=3711 RepID=A0A8D9H2Q9_BRACM|nr:unnamed protein product [Brassica rapa]